MTSLIVLHAALGVLILATGRRLRRRALWLAALGPGALLVWVGASYRLESGPVEEAVSWVPGLGLDLTFRVDGLSMLMLLLVGVAGVAIFGYAARYMVDAPRSARFAAVMVVFAGGMVGLVTADNLFALFVFWEITTVTSYLLVGHDDQRPAARDAALQALLTTGVGGLVMLAGFVLLGSAAGSWSMADILAAPPAGVDVALLLILVGAFTKSAQVPFHFWLPGAMAAPTPASAFLHSATMVKAGVYLIARLAPTFAAVAWWRPLLLTVGLTTMFVGGWRALRQHDLKLLLAHGTVSQLGFLVALVGIGHPKASFAGLALLLAHGLFKATLFMAVGSIDHSAGGRDIRRLSGLRRRMPVTFVVSVLAVASMAAVPPLFGFVAKEAAFDALTGEWIALALLVALASALTVAYSARFIFEVFTGPVSPGAGDARERRNGLVGWPALLAMVSLLLGLAPGLMAPVVARAAEAVTGTAGGKLVLWPGPNLALALSMATLALGVALALGRRSFERMQGRLADWWRRLPSADQAYHAAVSGSLRGAKRVTATVQNGSLPAYLVVIVLTVTLLPVALAAVQGSSPWSIPGAATTTEWSLVAVMVVAAAALVRVQRRFAAVLLLGGIGYAVAGLYLLQGGPDLALTLILVETLLILLFALVLVRLPSLFDEARRSRGTIVVRAATASVVAAFAGIAGIVAASARNRPPISEGYLDLAVPEAGGANLVNVILVDFRALDTLGEITVLLVAALGVAGLVLPLAALRSWGTRRLRESTVLNTAVDVVFPAVIVFAVYLLFAGHNQPGGGFAGGLAAGAALILLYTARGIDEVHRRLRVSAPVVLGIGLALAIAVAVLPMAFGGAPLESAIWEVPLPVVGKVKVVSVLLFDIGVFLVVSGMVLQLLDAFDARRERAA